MKILRLTLSLCFSLSCVGPALAQDTIAARPVTSVVTMGLGQGKLRDTYLTPLLYDGPSYTVNYERWRLMRRQRWNNAQTADFNFLSGEDRGRSTRTLAGRARYRYAMHRLWRVGKPTERSLGSRPFSLFAGPYAGFDLGFNYNTRIATGNNPATLRLAANAGLSLGAVWHLSMRQQPWAVQLQVRTPLMGAAFVPEYGASYYETFMVDDNPEVLHFTSLHNQQDLDVRLTADIPLATFRFLKRLDTTVRVGFAYHIETMDINHIVTRQSTCELVLGWTYQYLPFSRRKANLLKSAPAYAY